uniref:DM13 domain-containing protein n=1 Tax=Parastrongyloides trichosuri TaxID=131310 RepID=A0A0N5A368_PARTI
MPVGAIYYGIGKMSGEIYAGDAQTVYINRYHHNPKEKGCFALMVGPATEDDIGKSYSIGNFGILLSKTNNSGSELSDNVISKRIKRGWKNVIEIDYKTNNKSKIKDKIYTDNNTLSFDKTFLNKTKKEYNNSPDKLTFHKKSNSDYRYNPSILTQDSNKFTSKSIETFQTTKPSYWVIDDPRAARRRAREEAYKLRGLGNYLRRKSKAFSTKTTFSFAYLYELPITKDTFTIKKFYLPENKNITNYKWIGLYDQCVQKTIPLLTLKDIEPPKSEKIAPISGWGHGVSSYRVHVINCNTILIPGFTFNKNNTFSNNTFMYVGIGLFPEKIAAQYRTHIDNQNPDTPLRNYKREDLLVTLPSGLKTFDVDFLSIYNDDEKKSYGNIIFPSILVPPCLKDEDIPRLTGKAKQI